MLLRLSRSSQDYWSDEWSSSWVAVTPHHHSNGDPVIDLPPTPPPPHLPSDPHPSDGPPHGWAARCDYSRTSNPVDCTPRWFVESKSMRQEEEEAGNGPLPFPPDLYYYYSDDTTADWYDDRPVKVHEWRQEHVEGSGHVLLLSCLSGSSMVYFLPWSCCCSSSWWWVQTPPDR